MSVANITGENGIILPQFLPPNSGAQGPPGPAGPTGPAGPLAPAVYANFYASLINNGVYFPLQSFVLAGALGGAHEPPAPTGGIAVSSSTTNLYPSTAGSIVTLPTAGVYEVSYSCNFTSNATGSYPLGVQLATGTTANTLAELDYTLVVTATTQVASPASYPISNVSGTFLVTAPSANYALTLIAAQVNSADLLILSACTASLTIRQVA